MASERVDVLVVGAGLAGLTAACRLSQAGASVCVLEARPRVGGRLLGQRFGRLVLDLGGQWIGPTQDRMLHLADELGLETFPSFCTGKKVLSSRGKLSTYASSIPSFGPLALVQLELAMRTLERLRKQVDRERPWTAARASEWDAISVAAWMRRIPSAAVRGAFAAAVRTVFGVEPSELSFLHFLFYANSGGGLMRLVSIEGGAQERRFVEGAQNVAELLAQKLGDRVRLAAPVRAIEQTSDEVRIVSDGGVHRARRVVVAVPPLFAGQIQYQPSLPVLRDQLTQRMPMGATLKVIATYPRPFWRERGLSGEAVTDDGPMACVFDDSAHDGSEHALLGFVVGQPARDLAARSPNERRRTLLGELGRLFGAEAASPERYVEHDWQAEPWTRGCPIGFAAPGVLTSCGSALREPIGRLHFAGTETARQWTGYMEGAVESGERAADEALRELAC